MPLYECTFITRPDLPQAEVNKHIDKYSTIIAESGGKVIKTEHWGVRNLAYKIKKNRKGNYVMLGVNAPDAAMKEVERNMKISDDVIRNMTIRVEELNEEPSVVLQQKFASETEDKPEQTAAVVEEQPTA